MKLLRTSLGRGLEDCKAALASLTLQALRGAVTDILVADDQRFIRDMVRITLSTQGWTIAEAATPDQTVDLAHRDPPRAVLLDVNFDESDGPTGFDVCKLLKNDPATKAIPVVMLTARDSSADRKAGLAAGASHYLIKPFGPIDLINTLRGILGEPPAVQTLGQYLIDEGILSHEQLAEALERQRFYEARGHPRRLGEVLAIMRAISPDELERALERQKKETKP
jgi:DNA-binding response OmpR family regulator